MKLPEEADFRNTLRGFTGTSHYYPTIFGLKYTDGCQYVADTCKCYWLMDDISAYQTEKKVKEEGFQVWKLTVDVNENTGKLVCEDGNYNQVFEKEITFTDFPYPELTVWMNNGVIMLPGEY